MLTTVCRMPVPLEVHDSPTAVGLRAAEVIARGIAAAAAEGRRYVLGCPSGRSPLPTYAELARLVAERGLDLRPVIIALMDEYVSRTGDGFAPVDDRLPHSCVGFARRRILAPLNAAAAPGRGVGEHGLRHPDPAAAPGEYDRELAGLGGIDLFLLASGASDGHIALNPAGTGADSVTRVVALAEATRRDNQATFPTLRRLSDVPTHGVTVGIATIRDLSRSVIMITTGVGKRVAVRHLAAADGYRTDWPATVLADCRDPLLLVDRAAAGHLPADR